MSHHNVFNTFITANYAEEPVLIINQQFKATTFRYWVKRFSTPEESPSARTQFAEVTLQSNSINDKFEKTACGTKEEFSKTDTTKHVQAYSSEFQVFINNIRVIVPGDFSPAALAGLMKVLKTL
jgi:hypothetical protein